MQDGIKQTEVDGFVAQQFKQADTGSHGCVNYQDFCDYYQAMSVPKARLELRTDMGLEAERETPLLTNLVHSSLLDAFGADAIHL